MNPDVLFKITIVTAVEDDYKEFIYFVVMDCNNPQKAMDKAITEHHSQFPESPFWQSIRIEALKGTFIK